ncbi:unnamed protein product [Phytophthora fragariaefolia]|uniref:Unnamed protein product n=1 Tax=Phytophthora fragariaefolia TaxID=1490495 RepID=A0A9W6XSL8_9STRA|nr:unnamed protein product [Phytophthora fragariaefolia]
MIKEAYILHTLPFSPQRSQRRTKMNAKSLARQLIRGRLDELADMKNKLVEMRMHLEKMLEVQLELQALMEDNEECGFMLAALNNGITREEDAITCGVLLEMVVTTLLQGGY